MENKSKFTKFQIAQLKRTAQNVSQMVRRKETITKNLAELNAELQQINMQISGWQAPIKVVFDGYTTEDLVEKQINDTGKVDPKTGKPIKVTKFVLKYPETVIPPTAIQSETESVVVDDNDNVVEEPEFDGAGFTSEDNNVPEEPKSEIDEIEELFN